MCVTIMSGEIEVGRSKYQKDEECEEDAYVKEDGDGGKEEKKERAR